MDARRRAGHAWPEDVCLDRVAAERDDQRQQPDQGSFEGQRDEHRDPHPDRRADQREELEEKGQDSEHHGIGHANQRHREAGIRPHDE